MRNRLQRFSKSSNPMLKETAFRGDASAKGITETFTMSSAINKTLLLFGVFFLASIFSYTYPSQLLTYGGMIGAFVVAIVVGFRPQRAPVWAPIFAILEGLFVGGISLVFASAYSGILFQAITLTMMVFLVMLMVYKSQIIPVTDRFRTGVVMAMGAVFLIYLLSFILSLFGIRVPYIHESGLIGIGFSIAVLGIASLFLLLDFDFFEKGEEYGAPAYMEWYAGMSLLITLVWIYIELLRLLAKLKD